MRTPVTAMLLLAAPAAAQSNLLEDIVALELGRHYEEPLLQRGVRSTDAATRRAAARAAGRIRDERAVNLLLPLLRDPVGPVRRSALFALGQIGARTAVIPLRQALAQMPARDLPHALEALGKLHDQSAVATVVSHLDDPSPLVRGEAALALFRLGDESALTELMGALRGEGDPEARWRMVYAAFRLLRSRARGAGGPVAVDEAWAELLDRSLERDRPFAERVFAAMARGATMGGREPLAALLADPDARVVVAAIRGLDFEWDAETAVAVRAQSDHPDELVREAVVRHFIAGIGKGEKEGEEDEAAGHLRTLRGRLKPDWLALLAREAEARARKDASVEPGADEEWAWRVNSHFPERLPPALPASQKGKLAAAEVCGETRVPESRALPTLLALLKERDFVVRAVAIGSLAKRGANAHAAAIVDAARRAPGPIDMDVRIEAANALATLGVFDPWLEQAAAEDGSWPVRDAARAALKKLGREPPPAPRARGFRLHGHDAAGVLRAARALRGARVTLETSRGRIVMVLYPDEAPAHCVNFATLVDQGFYDKKKWHRVVADFVIQGGCPRGDGWGGPGYLLPDEIGTRPYVRGTVGMPKAGDDTGGCQIFITHLPTPHLDGRYTVYAQVIEGLDVVDRIRVGDTIEKATITVPGG